MSIATIDNKGDGVKLVDINPEKSTTRSNTNAGYIFGYINNNNEYGKYPCCGYDKIALYRDSSAGHTCKYGFLLSDGTITTLETLSAGAWTSYVQIPNNAIDLLVYYSTTTGATAFGMVISLLAKDSPYNV